MTIRVTGTGAREANIPRCDNCNQRMPALLQREAKRFCSDTCCHEWSSKVIGAMHPEQAFRILNALRRYLKAKLEGQGETTALVAMCMECMEEFRELELEKLCPQTVVLEVIEAGSEDEPELEFPQ